MKHVSEMSQKKIEMRVRHGGMHLVPDRGTGWKERILYNVVKPTRENTLSAAETGIFRNSNGF